MSDMYCSTDLYRLTRSTTTASAACSFLLTSSNLFKTSHPSKMQSRSSFQYTRSFLLCFRFLIIVVSVRVESGFHYGKRIKKLHFLQTIEFRIDSLQFSSSLTVIEESVIGGRRGKKCAGLAKS